jgi:L-ascorbate metabolism protein UlaG (beta-lactamase superfamily)
MIKYILFIAILLVSVIVYANNNTSLKQVRYINLFEQPNDTKSRASVGYMLHRAWVQVTNKKADANSIKKLSVSMTQLEHDDFSVTWLGHDTILIKAGELWILTDPVFSQYATPTPPLGPKRLVPLPLDMKDLPHIDIVLISHDHYDHLDLQTARNLAKQENGSPLFLTGLGLKSWFKANVADAKVEELNWWGEIKLGNAEFVFVPAQHSSGRAFTNKNETLWGGWIVEYASKKFYFAGDTAYEAELFKQISQKVGHIDLAALPIGAYKPRNIMRFEHMNPSEAVQAHRDLNPVKSIAIHWGTFQLGDETSDENRTDFASAIANQYVENFKLIAIGQTEEIGIEVQDYALKVQFSQP